MEEQQLSFLSWISDSFSLLGCLIAFSTRACWFQNLTDCFTIEVAIYFSPSSFSWMFSSLSNSTTFSSLSSDWSNAQHLFCKSHQSPLPQLEVPVQQFLVVNSLDTFFPRTWGHICSQQALIVDGFIVVVMYQYQWYSPQYWISSNVSHRFFLIFFDGIKNLVERSSHIMNIKGAIIPWS